MNNEPPTPPADDADISSGCILVAALILSALIPLGLFCLWEIGHYLAALLRQP